MLFARAVPPGADGSPETFYTGLDLSDFSSTQRPYVVCNFVSSADGKATAAGRSGQLGGTGDRATFQLLRTQVDAVLAGTQTMRVERYGPLVREASLSQIRLNEGREAQPLAVLISRSGKVPFDIPLFSDPDSRVALYTSPDAEIPESPARVTRHELPSGGDQLGFVLGSLRRDHDVRSVLCEGGPTLFNALVSKGLVDELFLTLSPALVGGGELTITTGPSLDELLPLRLVWALERDGNLFLRYALR